MSNGGKSMKRKNKNHQYKHVISPNKFNRILDQNLDKAGFCYITRNWETSRSLAAVKIGDFIYAQFSCKPKENRLESYYIRYKIEEGYSEDFVSFAPFPIPVL